MIDKQEQQLVNAIACLQEEIDKLKKEVERLKRGDFTTEEFQNLCHNLHNHPHCTRSSFEQGCVQFQEKLFGPKETT